MKKYYVKAIYAFGEQAGYGVYCEPDETLIAQYLLRDYELKVALYLANLLRDDFNA